MVNGSSVLDLAATTHWDESVGRGLLSISVETKWFASVDGGHNGF